MTSEVPSTTAGTLYDQEIEDLASRGQLIVDNFEKKSIKQACYELRAGYVYFDLSQGSERNDVAEGDYILIKPRQQVVIITLEELRLPDNILGRILTKGRLFSVGLLPVNTYADPGFRGNLGIVLFNSSTHYLKIYPGEPVAKIEFTRLQHSVADPYHGQHGFKTGYWDYPKKMVLTEDEIKRDKRILDPDNELFLSYGPEIPRIVSRISRYERPLIIASGLYFTFILGLVAFYTLEAAIPLAVGVGVGIVANFFTTFLTHRATDFLGRKR